MADITYEIDKNQRLDLLIAKLLKLSRQDAIKVLQQDKVMLNGRPVSHKAKGKEIQAGQTITIRNYTPEANLVANNKIELEYLQKNLDFVVVNKPANMPVHPLEPGETNTVLNAIYAKYPQILNVGTEGPLRSGVVHRLDLPTTGCLIFALNNHAYEHLRQAFKTHQTFKSYTALLQGNYQGKTKLKLQLAITKKKNPATVSIIPFDQHPLPSGTCTCNLSLTPQQFYPNDQATLVEIILDTGYLHQIRTMMAHAGHPLIGDDLYNKLDTLECLKAYEQIPLCLHAQTLQIEVPELRKNINADAPLPPEFFEIIDALNGEAK